jgi:hypothetical protein
MLAIGDHLASEPDRIGPGALQELPEQEDVKLAAMHDVLWPIVAGEAAARLRVDVVTIQTD